MNIYVDSKMNEDTRRREIYSGAVIVHSPSPSALELCRLAQSMIEEAFRPFDPMKIHEHLPAEKCAEILAVLKPRFIHHPLSKQCIQGMLSEIGADLSQTYFDVPRMRTAFPGDYLKSGIAYAFHPHRAPRGRGRPRWISECGLRVHGHDDGGLSARYRSFALARRRDRAISGWYRTDLCQSLVRSQGVMRMRSRSQYKD